MRRIKIIGVLSSEQMKARVKKMIAKRGKAAIVMPKVAGEIEFSDAPDKFDNPEFIDVTIAGTFAIEPTEGVDGNGKVHKLNPGGYGMYINWSAKGIGFGEFKVQRTPDGKVIVNTERLGKEFLKKALSFLVDKAQDSSVKLN